MVDPGCYNSSCTSLWRDAACQGVDSWSLSSLVFCTDFLCLYLSSSLACGLLYNLARVIHVATEHYLSHMEVVIPGPPGSIHQLLRSTKSLLIHHSLIIFYSPIIVNRG